MTRKLVVVLGVALSAATLSCGSSSGSSSNDNGSPGGGSLDLGAPITGLAQGQWSWVPFPDSACSDGSPTGIGVNPGAGPDLVLFLEGGGACASGLSCFSLHTATLGPFGATEFAARLASVSGSILDRTLVGNPFADATLVYVPYCTGDVHGGDRVVTYADGPGGIMHHVGHSNVVAFMKRLAPTYPAPRRLVVSGSSAGGFGALVNYDTVRQYYPLPQGFLVDDSGPPLESNGGPLIQAGFQSWGIADVLDPLCGGAGVCEADLSKGLAALLLKYPADRFSLLSWDSDPTISSFYFVTQAAFTTALLKLTSDVIDPAPNARVFIAPGQIHTMLQQPGAVSQNGVPLLTFLAQEVSGSAAWASQKP